MLICNKCGFIINETGSFCSNCGAVLNRASAVTQNVRCVYCTGLTRHGQIYAEKELTIVLTDRDEERFIHAFVCMQCARVQFIVDFETEVEE